jgi:hypothetical protein
MGPGQYSVVVMLPPRNDAAVVVDLGDVLTRTGSVRVAASKRLFGGFLSPRLENLSSLPPPFSFHAKAIAHALCQVSAAGSRGVIRLCTGHYSPCSAARLRNWVLLLFGSSPTLYSSPKFKAVDEQTDDEIVDLRGLQETNGSSGQALKPRAQRQMFAF